MKQSSIEYFDKFKISKETQSAIDHEIILQASKCSDIQKSHAALPVRFRYAFVEEWAYMRHIMLSSGLDLSRIQLVQSKQIYPDIPPGSEVI